MFHIILFTYVLLQVWGLQYMLVKKKIKISISVRIFSQYYKQNHQEKKVRIKKTQLCDLMRNSWDIQNQTVLLTKPLHHLLINIQGKNVGDLKCIINMQRKHFNSSPPKQHSSKWKISRQDIGQWSIIILMSFIKFLNLWINFQFTAPDDAEIGWKGREKQVKLKCGGGGKFTQNMGVELSAGRKGREKTPKLKIK